MPVWAMPLLLFALIRLSLRELYPFRASAHPNKKSRGMPRWPARAPAGQEAARSQPALTDIDHKEREMALINARRDMDKELPRFTFDSSLDLIQAVEKAEHVSDFGIGALAFVQRYGLCSLHGEVTDEVEVSNGVAIAEAMIRCHACKDDFGITKKCVVEAVGPVERD